MKMHNITRSKLGRGSRSRSRAFTLIELLVVVAILLILMGIIMKITTSVGSQNKRANIVMNLEKIHNALEGYYGANGYYPPGDTVNGGSWFRSRLVNLSYTNVGAAIFDENILKSYPTAIDEVTSAGMLYYLYTDPQSGKWISQLSGVMNSKEIYTNAVTATGQHTPPRSVTNRLLYIENKYWYECGRSDNYQRYRLWYIGEDNKNGTDDDIEAAWQQ